MALARRCSICAIDWPMSPYKVYRTCAQCGGNTDEIGSGSPLEAAAAESLRKHLAFEEYYTKREHERLRKERDSLVLEDPPIFSD